MFQIKLQQIRLQSVSLCIAIIVLRALLKISKIMYISVENNCNKYIKLYVHFHSVQCLTYWTNVK